MLEVSSPGIDRPLTRITDFARWSGHEAKLELDGARCDRPQALQGHAARSRRQRRRRRCPGHAAQIPVPRIAEAKLVLTDKLIEEDLKARKTPKQ